MRTITIEKTLYTFAELSDTAKDRARAALDTFEFSAEWVLEDFCTIAGLLGFYDVTPRYSGFWSQGDGASFTGRYSYTKGAAKAVRAFAPQNPELHRIADGLQALQKRHFYRVRAVLSLGTRSNFYAHENTITCDVTANDAWIDDAEFCELARDLMRWLYRCLESEYDHCNSDEYIIDHCESNGYEFDKAGRLQ